MLSAGMLREEVDVILELIAASKMEEAKQRMELLRPQVTTDYGKGALLALGGVLTTLAKGKGGVLLDKEKTRRTSERLTTTQSLDEVDRGYYQTISKYMKKVKPQPTESRSEARA